MKFYYLLSLIIVAIFQSVIASQDLKQNQVDSDQSLNVDQPETLNESYVLGDGGAGYRGECVNIDEIINNYMADYEVNRTGKREGYKDCLIRKGVIIKGAISEDEEENMKNNDKLMKIYMADLFRIATQTFQGRAMLKQFFQDEPNLIQVYRDIYQFVMPDFDEILAEIMD